MNTQQVKTLLKSTNGKVFSVTFRKKDGTLREMNCRLGVTAPLKTGEQSSTSHIDKYLTVYDMKVGEYRNINCETVERVSIGGKVITIK